jgi:hypothetical protein
VDPSSPYYTRFAKHEQLVDGILRTNRLTPGDVARVVHRSLTARRPRLRYVAGWRVGVLIGLKRRLPEEFFMRTYMRLHERMVQRQQIGRDELSELAVPSDSPTAYLGLPAPGKTRGRGAA